MIRLFTRADDAGSAVAANEAIEAGCNTGFIRNLGVMVPAPAFEDAAKRFAGRTDVDIGLHVTLNAEWITPRWGPVLSRNEVPHLVREDGSLHFSTQTLHDTGITSDEMMREVQAQLQRARDAGFTLSYVDTHMGVAWIRDLEARLMALAEREGLFYVKDIPGLGRTDGAGTLEDLLNAALDRTPAGDFMYVMHPAKMSDETRIWRTPDGAEGKVAAEREAEHQLVARPAAADRLKQRGVALTRFSER